jgi:magnesium-transporting ATPase (P-type)
MLKLTGIIFLMLAGESVDTAKKIGISCNLISLQRRALRATYGNQDTIENLFKEFNEYINKEREMLTQNPS